MSEWLPIESAPQDGTVVDLWCVRYELKSPRYPNVVETGSRVANCYWRSDVNGWHAKLPGTKEQHIVEIGSRAVYWMPLPEPSK